MRMPRLLAFAPIIATLAAVPAPAGPLADGATTCGIAVLIKDPDIRAAFERFDRSQSAGAGKVCAYYRNDMAATRRGR